MSVDISHQTTKKFTGDVPGRSELLHIPYDSVFWTNNTVLKTTPLEDAIIADLGGGASLSEQFLLYKQYDANTTNLGRDGDKKFKWFREYSKDNRVLYLVFWSQDVGQYIVPIERIKQLHRQYRDDITFVFLSTVDDEATWKQLVERYNLSADGILNYRIGSTSDIIRTYSIRQAPEFVLISKTGEVYDAHAKKPGDPNLVGDLETLIGKKD
jgi:hypothetical protein